MDFLPISVDLKSLNCVLEKFKRDEYGVLSASISADGLIINNVDIENLFEIMIDCAKVVGIDHSGAGWIEDTDCVLYCFSRNNCELINFEIKNGDEVIYKSKSSKEHLELDCKSIKEIIK